MLQVIVVFVSRPALLTVQGFFLCNCPPCGIFEVITTPLTVANRFSNLGVMTKDFGVCCISSDVAEKNRILMTRGMEISYGVVVRAASGQRSRRL